METKTKKQIAAETVREYMNGPASMGTGQYYQHWLSKGHTYTDGVKIVAEQCGAYWLIDAIFSHQRRKLVAAEPFQVWELTPPGTDGIADADHWALRCWRDTPNESKKVAEQLIVYSDFPEELCPFQLWLENQVLYLPPER